MRQKSIYVEYKARALTGFSFDQKARILTGFLVDLKARRNGLVVGAN